MASANFLKYSLHFAKGDIDFDTISLKVMLVTSVPSEANLDAWEFRSDVTNEHAATGGYTAGGVAQAYTLGAVDTTNDKTPITFTNNSTAWTSATLTAVGSIIYKDTGSAATDILMQFIDFGGTVSSTAGTFALTYTATHDIVAG